MLKRDRRLLAEDPFQRAEIRRLTEWFLQKMEQDVTRPLARERVYKLQMTADQGGGAPDSQDDAHRARQYPPAPEISHLAGRFAPVAGRRPAELCRSRRCVPRSRCSTISARSTGPEAPIVKDWYQRLKSRPSFRPLLTERVRGLTPVSHYADLDF